MIKKHLFTALALITVSGFAWAAGAIPSFQSLDTNHDGVISRDEAKKAPEVSKEFTKLDANKDSKLDQAEFSALETAPSEGAPKGGMPQQNMPQR